MCNVLIGGVGQAAYDRPRWRRLVKVLVDVPDLAAIFWSSYACSVSKSTKQAKLLEPGWKIYHV
jgi:hypothetical protein